MSRNRRWVPAPVRDPDAPPPAVLVLCGLTATKLVVTLAGAVALFGTWFGAYSAGLLALGVVNATLVAGLWRRRRWAWFLGLADWGLVVASGVAFPSSVTLFVGAFAVGALVVVRPEFLGQSGAS